MENLKQAIIDSLVDYAGNEEKFLQTLDQLVEKYGDRVYPILLKLIAHLDFNEKNARQKWKEILAHQKSMSDLLNRPVSLFIAVCDFFSTVEKSFQSPKIVELDVFERTAQASNFDSLTGLYNRGFFDLALIGEFNRAKRYGGGFSLLFLDLDDFKKLNDTYGHLAGDYALRHVAELVIAEKRTEDIAARYGGEEMVVILPETHKVKSLVIGERIRQKVEDLKMSYSGDEFSITLSGGLAGYPMDASDEISLVRCADRAMYAAKAAGKNRIKLFSEDKRQYLRIDYIGDVQVNDLSESPPKDLPVKSKDLSMGGLLFLSDKAFQMGDHLQVQMPLPDEDSRLVLIGKVVRVEKFDDNYEIGISFLRLAGQMKNRFANFLSELLGVDGEENLNL